jgi:hypothetical protein
MNDSRQPASRFGASRLSVGSIRLGWPHQVLHPWLNDRKVLRTTQATLCIEDAQSFAMEKTHIVDTVATALAYFMSTHKNPRLRSANGLGKAAGVSARTVGNFLSPEGRTEGDRGKRPSGKLTELMMIADALGIEVADLVSDQSPAARAQRTQAQRVIEAIAGTQPAPQLAHQLEPAPERASLRNGTTG